MNYTNPSTTEGAYNRYFPVLTEFATSPNSARMLSTISELSFLAGLERDLECGWRADMERAVKIAFGHLRAGHRRIMIAHLTDRFEAGRAQALIMEAERPSEAAIYAHALATVLDTEEPKELLVSEITNLGGDIAFKVAKHFADDPRVTEGVAAGCATDAMRNVGRELSPDAGAFLIERAANGLRFNDHQRNIEVAAEIDRLAREEADAAAVADVLKEAGL